MQIQIADRMAHMNPSAVREILKVTSLPGVISFAAGNPSPETFPMEEVRAIADEILTKSGTAALQYGLTEGYPMLRELTAKRISEKYHIGGPEDELVIVSGGQQGIDLAAKCLVNEGDTVLCENPSFIGALNTFRSYRARLVGIPFDSQGMDMEALERALETEPNVKMIYTIPTFQNPGGVTLSLERRKRMYELAVRHNVVILEDSPYFELRYSGADIPTIKSLDKTGHVLFVGSYSKVFAPGVRVGYVCGNKDLVAKMVVGKQCEDVHTNQFYMMVIAKYLEQADLDAHITACRKLYKAKRDVMLQALDSYMDPRIAYTRPDGGLFIWCTMPDGYSGTDICAAFSEKKVAAVPGCAFDPAERRDNPGFRLNFSMPSAEEIRRGVSIMGGCVKEFLG